MALGPGPEALRGSTCPFPWLKSHTYVDECEMQESSHCYQEGSIANAAFEALYRCARNTQVGYKEPHLRTHSDGFKLFFPFLPCELSRPGFPLGPLLPVSPGSTWHLSIDSPRALNIFHPPLLPLLPHPSSFTYPTFFLFVRVYHDVVTPRLQPFEVLK